MSNQSIRKTAPKFGDYRRSLNLYLRLDCSSVYALT